MIGHETEPKFDVTPEILYKDGRAVKITTYCVVNNWTRSESEVRIDERGNYTESCFDEHHGICRTNEPITRSRLEEIDSHNPRSIPTLSVLGTERSQVENLLQQLGIKANHIGS